MNIEEASIPAALRRPRAADSTCTLPIRTVRSQAAGTPTSRRSSARSVAIDYTGYLSFEVMAPSGDPMGVPAGAGPESFDADTKQAIEAMRAVELAL